MVVDHAYVIDPYKGPSGSHRQVIVVLGVDSEAFGLHNLSAVFCQVYQDF